MKKILITLLATAVFSTSTLATISAETSIENEYSFLDLVKETEYYDDYQSEIIEIEVLREAETDLGRRFTVQYVLNSKEDTSRYLTIVGDDKGNILVAMIVYSDENIISSYDLIEEVSNNIYINAKGPVYLCSKYTCTSYKTQIGVNSESACSIVVGQQCNIFSLIGQPVAALICKAGVWIACRVTIDKVCTNYYEELDVCEL